VLGLWRRPQPLSVVFIYELPFKNLDKHGISMIYYKYVERQEERGDDAMLTVFAEKLPSGNVLITRESGEVFCEWNKFYSSCPTKRNKYVTLNCYKWDLKWR